MQHAHKIISKEHYHLLLKHITGVVLNVLYVSSVNMTEQILTRLHYVSGSVHVAYIKHK